jgi:hypothetical protein
MKKKKIAVTRNGYTGQQMRKEEVAREGNIGSRKFSAIDLNIQHFRFWNGE